MTESADPKTPLFGGKAAAILGAVFLTLFALFTLWAAMDRVQRPRLETIQTQ